MPGRVRVRAAFGLRSAFGYCQPASPLTALALLLALTFSTASWVRQAPPFRDAPALSATESDSESELSNSRPPALYDLGVSSDEKRVCLRAFDRPAGVYDLSTGERLSSFDDVLRLDSRIALSPDGRYAAVGLHQRGGLLLAEIHGEPRRLSETCAEKVGAVMAVAFSSDGRWLASATLGEGGSVSLWDTHTWELCGRLARQDVGIKNLAFSSDGARIAAVLADGRVTVWEPHAGSHAHYGDPQHFIRDADFLASTNSIATCGDDGAVWEWDLAAPGKRRLLGRFDRHLMCVTVSRDGKRLACADVTGNVGCISLETGDCEAVWQASSLAQSDLEFSTDGNRLYGTGHDGVLSIWSTETFEPIRQLTLSASGRLLPVSARR